MNPSFFGPPGEQLLGIHFPARGAARGLGVLLCPPAPQETSRTHWALRKLAEQLAKAGFDVLRFDYRGTNDSNGELADTTPRQWVEDIGRAAEELKAVAGLRRIAIVGFRLGGLLAAQAVSEGLAAETLVLWEPVVNVAQWLTQLELIDVDLHRTFYHPMPPERGSVLGYVLPDGLRGRWDALELTAVPRWATPTHVVIAVKTAPFAHLEQAWRDAGQLATWHLVDRAAGDGKKTGSLLGNEALDQIVHVLGGRP